MTPPTDRDIVAAIRLAVASAGDDRAAVAAISALLGYALPSDGRRHEPVQLLVRAIHDVRELSFALRDVDDPPRLTEGAAALAGFAERGSRDDG
jgi:hypothetical protein